MPEIFKRRNSKLFRHYVDSIVTAAPPPRETWFRLRDCDAPPSPIQHQIAAALVCNDIDDGLVL